MLNVILSVLLALATVAMAYLGVHVTLHPPGESLGRQRVYKGSFWICGLFAVGLVVIQGVRNNRSQQKSAKEIGQLETYVQSATSEAQKARTEASIARRDVENESARRQQAERDLLIALQAAGRETRRGVAEDIRDTPLKVSVSGGGNHTEEEKQKRRAVRSRLGLMMGGGRALMSFCISPPQNPPGSNLPPFSCEDQERMWEMNCAKYIQENMDTSYLQRFESATGLSLSWPVDQKRNAVLQRLQNQTDALEQFIKELLD